MTTHAPQAPADPAPSPRRPIRVWVDGCFDMMHYGHANALRQAKLMGDVLVVGVHSDADILHHKGPTVMKDAERYAAVRACKWVDEVVEAAPYVTRLEYLDKYNCDFCVHGDDVTTAADGTDSYGEVKAAGRYRECKRTVGVSTTEIVGRMLLMTRVHHYVRRGSDASVGSLSHVGQEALGEFVSGIGDKGKESATTVSHFLPTSRRIVQFSEGREPKEGDVVVYVDGAFDLFHVGHIEFLRKAKALGDYLLVGVHDDATVNRIKGSNHPIMNLHERVLSVLACRYVDEVIIGAPYSVTSDVLTKVCNVSVVAHGTSPVVVKDLDGKDPYELPKARGMYREVDHSLKNICTSVIIDRIIDQRRLYEDRQRRKAEKAVQEAEHEEAARVARQ